LNLYKSNFLRALTTISLVVIVGGAAKCTRTISGTATCPTGGGPCTVSVKGEVQFLTSDSLSNVADDLAYRVYILDLAKDWGPDFSTSPQATVSVLTDSGVISQAFNLSYNATTSQTLSRVDSDTLPNAFEFSNPNAVQGFLEAAAAGSTSSQPESTADIVLGVTQTNCAAPSGKYINHLRYQDGDSISYLESVYVQYTASPTAPLQCNQGQLEIIP